MDTSEKGSVKPAGIIDKEKTMKQGKEHAWI